MSWNAVLDKYIEIKAKALSTGEDIWNYDQEKETCIDYWVRLIGAAEYEELISCLEINEFQNRVLIRYGNYADVLSGSDDVTMDSFWDRHGGFYRECRSVVIDIKKDCLVLTPFRKFRNINEGEETSFENLQKRIKEASCVEFSDKLDGSMQSARYYNGEYVMAGSQSLDRNNSWRLADGYRMLMNEIGYQQMLKENEDKTFIFEYISERDAHVVKYEEEGLFLIGVRDVNSGEEASYREVLEYAAKYGVCATKVFDKTLEEVMQELDNKDSSEAEGFVVNIDGFKVKIKYNDYVYMHKMLSSISSINVIIQNIAEDHFDDMIAKVPFAYRDRVMRVAKIVFDYVKRTNAEIDAAYNEAPKADKKQFMIWVTNNVSREIQGFVRNKYLGKSYNVLKRGDTGYLRLKDMGVEEYQEVFE